MASNVTPLRVTPPTPTTAVLGPLDCTWRVEASSPVMSPRIQARDPHGILRCSLKLELLGGDLDAESVAQLLARIIGEYEADPAALMYAAMEARDV